MLIRIPSGVRAEVAFAYDVDTGKARFLGYGRDAYVNATDSEVCGTADIVRPGYVGDYKTGHAVLGPAAYSSQLKFPSMCMDALYPGGLGTVTGEYIFIREGYATPSYDRAVFTRPILKDFATSLKLMVASLREAEFGTRRFKEGLHCRNCHAFDFCPAKREMLTFLGQGTDLGTAYTRTREIETMAKRALERLKEIAAREPFQIGEGRFYGKSKRGKFEEYIVQ